MSSLDLYLPIAIYAILMFIVLLLAILVPRILGPGGLFAVVEKRHHVNEIYKYETYECAEVPIGDARVRFDMEYYIYPLIFLLFDIIAVFLYLWALLYYSIPMIISLFVLGLIAFLTAGLLITLSMEGVHVWLKKRKFQK